MRKLLFMVTAFLIPVIGFAQVRTSVEGSTPEDKPAQIETTRGTAIEQPVAELPSDRESVGSAPAKTKPRPGDVQGNLAGDDCMIPSGCGAWPSDPTGGGTPTGTTPTKCISDYCPACALDDSETRSICYKVFGQLWGYCSCAGSNSIRTDKYGNKHPKCTTSGFCSIR